MSLTPAAGYTLEAVGFVARRGAKETSSRDARVLYRIS